MYQNLIKFMQKVKTTTTKNEKEHVCYSEQNITVQKQRRPFWNKVQT